MWYELPLTQILSVKIRSIPTRRAEMKKMTLKSEMKHFEYKK